MDPTVSISKGIFVFKNGATKASLSKRKSQKSKNIKTTSFLDSEITEKHFYKNYKKLWNWIDKNISELRNQSFTKIIDEILQFIQNAYKNDVDNILPTAALLTGINQPDHFQQFEFLSKRINDNIQSKVVILQSRDCSTLKSLIETMVYNFIEKSRNQIDESDNENDYSDEIEYDDDDGEDNKSHHCLVKKQKPIKRSQCSMQVLKSWYENLYPNEEYTLTVIISDFECFPVKILEDFILILNSYLNSIPIILICGIATSITTFHDTLSYHVTSKMKIKIFHCESAVNALNRILENVILSPKFPFHLSGKAFQFLCDIFLFYDFSINGFIQGFKYCMIEHFLHGNAFALCTSYQDSLKIISQLNHDDLESIRHLLSFRSYVESLMKPQDILSILTDDKYLKNKLPELLKNCHIFFILYRYFLEFFVILLEDLPKTPLGKLHREIYAICIQTNIVELQEFKECWQMLGFLSKQEFLIKMKKAITQLENYVKINTENDDEISQMCAGVVSLKLKTLKIHLENVSKAGLNTLSSSSSTASSSSQSILKPLNPETNKPMSRHELKEKLLNMSKQEKPITEFMKSINSTLDYIKTEIIEKHLISINHKNIPTFYELFVFNDIQSIRKNIIGTPRAALHKALNNPHYYLQCDCCKLNSNSNNSLLKTLPDISIAYKLHLECGRMINLFDWLQAFKSVIDNNDTNDDDDDDDDTENDQIDPEIQARFTRAVAELQFLGFIKTSKRKTDHATRLTW